MSTRTVVIEGPERLEGVLHEGAGIGGAVMCHPHPLYGGSMWNGVVDAMEEGFSKAGFTTLRFNFRGVGRSTGRFDEGAGETEDLVAACRFLKGAVNARQFLKGEVSGEALAASPGRMEGWKGGRVGDLRRLTLPDGALSEARRERGLCSQPLLGERSESLSGEAPQALPVEGVLNPNNCAGDISSSLAKYHYG